VVVAEAMGMARFEDNRQDEGAAVPNYLLHARAPGESSSGHNASPAPDSCMQNHTKGLMSKKVGEKLCIAK
jgi:hypothetical protein